MAKEQLVNQFQTEIGQLKTTIVEIKRENEALKVYEEKYAAGNLFIFTSNNDEIIDIVT
jgi:hypothetical protein